MYSDQSTVETEIFQGKYRKIRELKTGGMGKVFLVEERRKKKRYIMKIVPADKKGSEIARFGKGRKSFGDSKNHAMGKK